METTIQSPPNNYPFPGPPNPFMARLADDDRLRMDARWLARLLGLYGRLLLQANRSPGVKLNDKMEPTKHGLYVWQVEQARGRELARTAISVAKELLSMCEMGAIFEEAHALSLQSRVRGEARHALV